MSAVKSYVKEVLARLTGDQSEVVAQKNYRKAVAGVKGQLAALESERIEAEMKLETAQEALHNAKYPTTLIGSVEAYYNSIVDAQEDVEEAEEVVASIDAAISTAKSLQTEFEKEEV